MARWAGAVPPNRQRPPVTHPPSVSQRVLISLRTAQVVLVVGHANCLRALIKNVQGLSDEEVRLLGARGQGARGQGPGARGQGAGAKGLGLRLGLGLGLRLGLG